MYYVQLLKLVTYQSRLVLGLSVASVSPPSMRVISGGDERT
jgi:hypothetical protein